MIKGRMVATYLVPLTIVFIFSITKAESFDPEVVSQVSKGIAEWKLMNNKKTQNGPQTYVSSSLGKMTKEESYKGMETIQGLSAFNNDKPYDFLRDVNKPVANWYGVDSMGIPGGWGAKNLPGEKIYVNINDPVAWLPSWRNITPIPATGGGFSVGLTVLHVPWGPGSSQKVIGTGGMVPHDLESYKQMAPSLQENRIRVHSLGGLDLYNQYESGGWQNIEPFQGKTILGAGVSPLDVGKGQISTGGHWSSFWGDVITRGVPWSLGIPLGSPLKVEAGIGTWGTGIGGRGMGTGAHITAPTMPKTPIIFLRGPSSSSGRNGG